MTVNNTATRDVYRPTMRRELLTPNNKGTEVVMVDANSDPVPPRTPITVVIGARWADVGNVYVVGKTVFAETAGYTGGLTDTTTYRWRIQTRPAADASWVNGSWTNYTDHGEEVSFPLTASGDIRFQCQARDTGIDPVEQINSFASIQTVESPSSLVYSNPVATGEPWVGETLSCSEPVVSGGIGPYQFDYFWVDETNAIVWDATYMGNTTTLVAYDIGKMMKCLVQVTDKGWSRGESVTVESNSIGPIAQRTIGNVVVTVDGNVVAGEESEDTIQTRTGEEHIIILTPDGDATGLKSEFSVRNGEARISQTANSCIVTIQSLYPGSVHIQCKLEDRNTVEGEFSQRVMFVIRE